jgi:glycosyltransferase involved in cell wall biosynthesis
MLKKNSKVKENSFPKVSVFLPTYNHEHFISECLDSIIKQDYPNLEIICGDDCSHDNTPNIVKRYEKLYSNMIVGIYNAKNLGITKNFNKILKKCTGKYIIFFSGDDLMLPGKISKLVNFMEQNPEYVMCYHDLEVFNSETRKKVCNYSDIGKLPSGTAANLLIPGTIVVGPAMIALKDSLPLGGFNETITTLSDWLLLIETATKGKIGFIPEVLSKYRRHFNNISNKKSHYPEYFIAIGILRSKYTYLAKPLSSYEGYVFMGFMVNYLRAKDYDLAFLCAREALIRLCNPHILIPINLIGLFRIRGIKPLIDTCLGYLFRIVDNIRKRRTINYKVYQTK